MSNYIAAKLVTTVSQMFLTSTTTPTPTTTTSVDVSSLPPITMLNVLKTILIAGVSIWGAIIIVKNVAEIGPAIEQRDSATISIAIKGIFGGAIMFFIGPVLALCGVVY